MKRVSFILAFIVTMISTNICKASVTKGDGVIKVEEMKIQDYDRMKLSGLVTVIYELKPDAEPYLRMEGDSNILPLLKINPDKGTLNISVRNIEPTRLVVYTNSKSLNSISLQGAVTLQIENKLSSKAFAIDLQGSAKLVCNDINSRNISVKTTGASNIYLKGRTPELICNISENGHVDTSALESKNINCSISGVGYLKAYAMDKMNININGSGVVEYIGSPKISKKITGSGKIENINSTSLTKID